MLWVAGGSSWSLAPSGHFTSVRVWLKLTVAPSMRDLLHCLLKVPSLLTRLLNLGLCKTCIVLALQLFISQGACLYHNLSACSCALLVILPLGPGLAFLLALCACLSDFVRCIRVDACLRIQSLFVSTIYVNRSIVLAVRSKMCVCCCCVCQCTCAVV